MDFVEEDIEDVARGLPDMMAEVETDYEFKENHFGFEQGPQDDEDVGAIAKYSISAPEYGIPHPRKDLKKVSGATATLEAWNLSSLDISEDVERKVQLYTGASRTTPREYRQHESEKLHDLLTTDIEEIMAPEPDRSEHIQENGSEVYEWRV